MLILGFVFVNKKPSVRVSTFILEPNETYFLKERHGGIRVTY
jgi:hypothetical protein